MAKTACEEAAEMLKNVYWLTSHPEIAEERAALDKRLRAEGRELKRLRALIFGAFGPGRSMESIYTSTARLHDEAARIWKARKTCQEPI